MERRLLGLFEGREELVVYRHMWFPGEPFENQSCPGQRVRCWAYWLRQGDRVFLTNADASFIDTRHLGPVRR